MLERSGREVLNFDREFLSAIRSGTPRLGHFRGVFGGGVDGGQLSVDHAAEADNFVDHLIGRLKNHVFLPVRKSHYGVGRHVNVLDQVAIEKKWDVV